MFAIGVRGWCLGLLLVVLGPGCGSNQRREVSGETHWLAACAQSEECARGECICGMCTERCQGDNDCSGKTPAQCYDVASPGLQDHCDSALRERGGAVCIATCEQDGECPTGNVCRAGACTPREPVSPLSTAPPVACERDADCSTGELCANLRCAASADVKASDFLGASPGTVDLKEPIRPPDPTLWVQGATPELMGTWQQQNCSPCLVLSIQTDAESQRIVGQLTRASEPGDRDAGLVLPTTLDPDVGYPPSDLVRYADVLWNGLPDHAYQLYDARLSGSEFSAWYSFLDLWGDWCALQTPTRIEVAGYARYVCSPDILDTRVDFGKRVLCTSADMSGCTPAEDAQQQPLSCRDPESAQCMFEKQCVCNTDFTSELCSPAYCECDATTCRANIWRAAVQLQLTLAGDRLAGALLDARASSTSLQVAFKRVAP